MKKISILFALMFLFSASVFAQLKPDYSGEWTLDKSKMSDGANFNVESINIKATQTAGEIKVETATKFAPQTGEMSGDGADGSQSKRVRRPLGDGTSVFTLDGKETITEVDSPGGKLPVKLQASFAEDGKLNFNTARTIKTPNGEIILVIKETWELADNGKTLKVKREITAPNGSNKVDMVFTKK